MIVIGAFDSDTGLREVAAQLELQRWLHLLQCGAATSLLCYEGREGGREKERERLKRTKVRE